MADAALSKTSTPVAPAAATKFRVIGVIAQIQAVDASGNALQTLQAGYTSTSGDKLAVSGASFVAQDSGGNSALGAAVVAAVQAALAGNL